MGSNIWVFAFCCLFCLPLSSQVTVSAKRLQYPLIATQTDNYLYRINLKTNETQTAIRGLGFDLTGSTDLTDIVGLRLYSSGTDSIINASNKKLLATVRPETPTGAFRFKASLDSTVYWWVSVQMYTGTKLEHLLHFTPTRLETADSSISIDPKNTDTPYRMGVALRKHRDDGVHTYRIPALVTSTQGTLLAAYDVRRDGSRDLQGDIDIGISRSTDGGQTWEPMQIALDMKNWGGLPEKFNGVSDASLLVDQKTGTLFVFGLWMHGVINPDGKWVTDLTETSTDWNHQWRNKGSQPGFGVKETSQFLMAQSTDDGKTWSKPVNLTQMCKKQEWWLWAPAPGNGIQLTDGTLVIPTQGRDAQGETFSNITYSKDGGQTWQTSQPARTNTTECAVVELPDGGLMLNMRDNRNRKEKGGANGRAVAVTYDLGENWQRHPSSNGLLPEPVCMGSLLAADGRLFFSNPNSKYRRQHITVKTSTDQGHSWPEKNWLLLDQGHGSGYSSLTKINEEYLGILYEGSQADLIFQKIPLTSLVSDKP
ncbi:hypothetical protein B7P33_03450 [Sediminicola luteus]|uniref:exo-alpha-sialidase n=1 Tax=Sediminicola luteus TaxID=319238 RepID=A0A2A4GCV5_9FLAO|nr:hypothetical protein B7P33_03450 [Sediminicola luteus]